MLPKGKAKARISSTSTTRSQQPVEIGASSSGAATAKEPAAAGVEAAGAFLRRGPPKIPKLQRIIGTPDLRRGIGESEQEYKFRLAGERYASVTGETEQEADMVDFFKQVLAADSRGVITSFALSVIVSRHWGRDHNPSDTSLVTIAKTEKQLVQWMHPNHFAPFVARSKDHHDLIHNGFLALTIAVSNIKTLLNTGNKVGGHFLLDALPPTSDRVRSAASSPILSVSLELTGAADEPVLVGGHEVCSIVA